MENQETNLNVNENVDVKENVEVVENGEMQTEEAKTEETKAEKVEEVKSYTQKEIDELLSSKQEEFNKVIGRKTNKAKTQAERDFYRNHKKELDLIKMLKKANGLDDVDELTNSFKSYYEENEIDYRVEDTPKINKDDEKALGHLYAQQVINEGVDEIEDTVKELTKEQNLNIRQKTMLEVLKNELKIKKAFEEAEKELISIGVDGEILKDEDFKKFASRYNGNVAIKEIYNDYNVIKNKDKKNLLPEANNKKSKSDEIKDFYTKEEASKFKKEELVKNPKLLKAIENSMLKW